MGKRRRPNLSHGASRYPNGEGRQAPLSNSQTAAQPLGGVSEGDRTGRADKVSRENSRSESATQPAGQGGEPTEPARAVGGVGVLRSRDDPPDSKTGGERRRGTWVRVIQHSTGSGDGRDNLDRNSRQESGTVKVTVTVGASPTVEEPSESRMRENRLSGLMRGGARRSLASCLSTRPLRLLYSIKKPDICPARQTSQGEAECFNDTQTIRKLAMMLVKLCIFCRHVRKR
jgi:hypothetical protein